MPLCRKCHLFQDSGFFQKSNSPKKLKLSMLNHTKYLGKIFGCLVYQDKQRYLGPIFALQWGTLPGFQIFGQSISPSLQPRKQPPKTSRAGEIDTPQNGNDKNFRFAFSFQQPYCHCITLCSLPPLFTTFEHISPLFCYNGKARPTRRLPAPKEETKEPRASGITYSIHPVEQ